MNATAAVKEVFDKVKNDSNDVTYLMLATMSSELQKQFVDMEAYDIMVHLKEMMAQGTSVSAHVLKMKGYIDMLEKPDAPIQKKLMVDLFLRSLADSYDQFVMNYNIHGMDKTFAKLHRMLKNAEQSIKKSILVLTILKDKDKSGNRKGKAKFKPKEKVGP
ncbi:uncharacterized protein LOC120278474 [Dioscorea cayenensis subsp. rotundata]|uniref:Uncharacterized protein LOC120278474 n=1 Tax=Dioscorea cayennensis subsp. rotundata TaxID=55577 RepID=A0AB40CML4_DIOCR|nr:uncharacterized protein LOC120278474 [Dioscorea cayenensis subsp. rotundata]